jgi:hypothetical protein
MSQERPTFVTEEDYLLQCSQQPPLIPTLSQMNPVNTLMLCLSEAHFNIVAVNAANL